MSTDEPLQPEVQPWWRRRAVVAAVSAVVVATVVSIVFRVLTPMWVILFAADDDQLYVRLGKTLIDGNWLGTFDRRTLEKPAGFSMFLAMAHMIPLPFLVVVHLFHLAAAGFFATALARVTSKRALGVVTYVVLALDPSYFSNGASRVVRDNWYSSISLIIVGCAVLAIPRVGWAPNADVERSRLQRHWRPVLVGVVAGVCVTGYWLARVERPWLLPPVAAVLAAAVVLRYKALRTGDGEMAAWRVVCRASAPLVLASLVATSVLMGSLSFVSWKNERAYGVNIIDDFYSGEFARMYGAWQSVEAGSARRYVSINREQREAVYAISPGARELEANVESPDSIWLGFGCSYTGICDDIVAGWLLFGLRDATFAAGHLDDAVEAQTYWSNVADEIEDACDDGRLQCRRPMPFSLPDPSRVHLGPWWDSTIESLDFLLDMKGAEPRRPLSGEPSTPDDDQLWSLFRSTVRGLPSTLAEQQADERAAGEWLEHLSGLRDIYRRVLVLAVPLAVIGYLVALWRRRSLWSRVFVVGASAGIAVAARVVVLGFVDSTTFPAADQPTYILPATAFLFTFVVTGLWLLVTSWRDGPRVEVDAYEPPPADVEEPALDEKLITLER